MTSAEETALDSLEMDTFTASVHRPRSVSRAKSVEPGRALSATRDYALGIGLLLIVVILWTSSNFITQVCCISVCNMPCTSYRPADGGCARACTKAGSRNRFCAYTFKDIWSRSDLSPAHRVTYLNTSAFALYLVPFLVRRWWRRRRGWEDGGGVNEVRRGR